MQITPRKIESRPNSPALYSLTSCCVYRILSASAKKIFIKWHAVNTQSSHDPEQRVILTGESADLDKWANVTMRSRLSSAAEAPSQLFTRAGFGDGCGGFGSVLLLSLMAGLAPATFDGWLNARTLWQRSAGKLWNCQPPFLLGSWVVTDSVGQTDDLTVQCWQLPAKRQPAWTLPVSFFLCVCVCHSQMDSFHFLTLVK